LTAALGGLASSPALGGENPVTSAVRVEARPQTIPGVADTAGGQSGLSVGTAVIVQWPWKGGPLAGEDGDNYLVTAYHVVERAGNVKFQVSDGYTAYWGRNYARGRNYTEEPIYVNTSKDLAIFKLAKPPAGAGGDDIGRMNGKASEQAIPLAPPSDPLDPASRVSDGSAKGHTAVAIGNPEIRINLADGSDNWALENVAYGGTVSELPSVEARLKKIVREAADGDEVAREVRKRVLNTQLLFLETLSITRGFSGGPVFVNTDRRAGAVPAAASDDRVFAGIIMGGSSRDDVYSGRYAYACPAIHVGRGLEALSKELDRRKRFPGVRNPNPEPGVFFVDYETAQWPRTAYKYGTAHGFATSRLVRGDRIRRDEIARYPGEMESGQRDRISYTFFDVTFDGVDFLKLTGGDLSNDYFINCTFINPSFAGVIMNGAVFQTPVFESSIQPGDAFGCLDAYGVPRMAHGVRIFEARWRRPEPVPDKEPAAAPVDDPGVFSKKPAVAARATAGEPLNVRRFPNYFDVPRR
jgi:hypothetical protein